MASTSDDAVAAYRAKTSAAVSRAVRLRTKARRSAATHDELTYAIEAMTERLHDTTDEIGELRKNLAGLEKRVADWLAKIKLLEARSAHIRDQIAKAQVIEKAVAAHNEQQDALYNRYDDATNDMGHDHPEFWPIRKVFAEALSDVYEPFAKRLKLMEAAINRIGSAKSKLPPEAARLADTLVNELKHQHDALKRLADAAAAVKQP